MSESNDKEDVSMIQSDAEETVEEVTETEQMDYVQELAKARARMALDIAWEEENNLTIEAEIDCVGILRNLNIPEERIARYLAVRKMYENIGQPDIVAQPEPAEQDGNAMDIDRSPGKGKEPQVVDSDSDDTSDDESSSDDDNPHDIFYYQGYVNRGEGYIPCQFMDRKARAAAKVASDEVGEPVHPFGEFIP
jgi:hypothetical protein